MIAAMPGRFTGPLTGLIVGRFDPPHLGHSHMIGWAGARCDELVVFVNTRGSDAVPGSLRVGWLAELHPDARVVQVDHQLDTDFADAALWERWMALFRSRWPLPVGPHLMFASDPYIAQLAERFGAEPVIVDAQRAAVPISSTMVRAAPGDHLEMLAPPVRAWVERNWL